jgi:hypothetical protein
MFIFLVRTEREKGRATLQGCQMVSFQTENHNFAKFRRALHRLEYIEFMDYFTDIWDIL